MCVENKENVCIYFSATAVAKLRALYRENGFLINLEEAEQELLWRFNHSVPASFEIINGIIEKKEQHQYFFEPTGFWPCLMVFDGENKQIVDCVQLSEWPIFSISIHSFSRFIKYSVKNGRCYSDREKALKDMMFRLIRSQKTGVEFFSYNKKKRARYPNSVYGIENPAGKRFPLVFVLGPAQYKGNQAGFTVITCYLFGSKRNNPYKKIKTRAQEKKSWRRLLKQINYGEEEE